MNAILIYIIFVVSAFLYYEYSKLRKEVTTLRLMLMYHQEYGITVPVTAKGLFEFRVKKVRSLLADGLVNDAKKFLKSTTAVPSEIVQIYKAAVANEPEKERAE